MTAPKITDYPLKEVLEVKHRRVEVAESVLKEKKRLLEVEEEKLKDKYTPEEKQHFIDYLDGQLAKIELPNKDIPFLRNKMLLMYANPVTNYLAANQEG